MYKPSVPKRTGIYRVCGNIADFRMELKLKHISDWLPVPKFEYKGPQPSVTHNDYYPGSTSSVWSDCNIYMPRADDIQSGGEVTRSSLGSDNAYYNYYDPSKRCSNSSGANATHTTPERSSNQTNEPLESTRSGTHSWSSSQQQDSEQLSYTSTRNPSVSEVFYAQNRELCNGVTAQLLIGWQQKHLSHVELEQYRRLSSCVTTLQRSYHLLAQRIADMQDQHERAQQKIRIRRLPAAHKVRVKKRASSTPLHSQTASLNTTATSTTTPASKTHKTQDSFDDRALSSLNMSEFSLVEDAAYAQRTCLIYTVVDADDHTEEMRKLQADGYQLMEVYAALQQVTLLVTLKYSEQLGLLYVYPDFCFSADDLDYMVEIDNDCRQLYTYGFHSSTALERVQPSESPTNSEDEDSEEQTEEQWSECSLVPQSSSSSLLDEAPSTQLLKQQQQQRAAAAEQRTLLQFAALPKRTRRVVLLLQLHQAQYFERPNVHVRYYVHVPPHTMLELSETDESLPLRGATHTCLGGGAARPAHLSHCWQLTLLCEEAYQPDQLLHIYFEVISVDSWQRERCEGYTYYACPLLDALPHSGSTVQQLHCVRPVGSWLDALNRYFIGGRTLFDFVGYFNVSMQPSGSDALHNRLHPSPAHAMRTTGTLQLSVQKLQQRESDTLRRQLSRSHSSDGDAETSDGTSSTLGEVMAAYVEARERIRTLLLDHQTMGL